MSKSYADTTILGQDRTDDGFVGTYLLDNDDGNVWYFWHNAQGDSGVVLVEIEHGNPSDDGQSTGLGPDQDAIDAAVEQAKKAGAPYTGMEIDALGTPIGLGLVENGKIPGGGAIDPSDDAPGGAGSRGGIDLWNNGDLFEDGLAGGSTGGGGEFDPTVPFDEQVPGHRGKKDDDGEGDGDDKNETYHGLANVDPEIVDPPPEPIGNGFVLLPPSFAGLNPGDRTGGSSAGMAPQPTPWAAFGGGMTAYPPDPFNRGGRGTK